MLLLLAEFTVLISVNVVLVEACTFIPSPCFKDDMLIDLVSVKSSTNLLCI